MARTTLAIVAAGLLAFGLVPAQPPAPPPAADMAEQAPAVAPPPREGTRITRKALDVGAFGPRGEVVRTFAGLEWQVEVGVRRLATGTDVIDIHWTIEYTGPRPPLHILRPSLADGWPDRTVALVSAVPKEQENGREVRFATPGDDAKVWRIFNQGPPESFYILAEGRVATGIETIPVPDLKALLQTRYPDEFPPGCPPPSLYLGFSHNATDRGGGHDCWTGDLYSGTLNVPDLADW